MWTKKVTVGYYNIEAAEDDYFAKFYDNMETILTSQHTFGTFEGGQFKYMWKLLERVDTNDTAAYLFLLVKERASWPVWFTDEGNAGELTIPNGVLGDISYGIVNPAYKFLLCFAAGAGGCAAGFKKMLGQFSPEGAVRLTPLFEEHIDEKVMSWDYFRRLSAGVALPSGEDLTGFASSRAGGLMKMVEYLGGLKIDISVSAGSGREALSNMMVKDLLPELLANDLCKSLIVRGSDFESAAPEQFDLKNAQIKYTEQIEVEGNYITESDAKQVLMRAMNERGSMLFR